jgi:tRNA (uracil-5-)-methyltransferase
VGFRLSSYKRGSKAVGKIDSLIHLPEKMVQGAQAFEAFIRKSSYEPFDPETHEGVWKQLTVRTSSTDLLLMLIISRKDLSQDQVDTLKKDIVSEFKEMKCPAISSFFIKELEVQGQKTKNEPELLFGKGYNEETMCDLSFRISSESFFQINSLAAEVLINAIKSHAELDEETCLLDICCGTGTLGLCLAKSCGEVHGVEIISSAVEDARVNAKENGLEQKCQFYCGKAEDIVDVLTYQTKKKKIVAIVDPPRAGVHLKVLQTLRRCSKINTIVYVSCDAEAAKKNFVDLARPESKKYRLSPFVPRRFIPVDLFPMSPHMELIVILQRIRDESCDSVS